MPSTVYNFNNLKIEVDLNSNPIVSDTTPLIEEVNNKISEFSENCEKNIFITKDTSTNKILFHVEFLSSKSMTKRNVSVEKFFSTIISDSHGFSFTISPISKNDLKNYLFELLTNKNIEVLKYSFSQNATVKL